jgi:multidrug efflux system membrane fusion protein
MQKYHGTEVPAAKGRRLAARLLRRALAVGIFAALAGVIVYASMLPSVQRQLTGRRAKMGDGPVPVTVAQAKIADVPLYLEGVGTAKARKTVTVRPQVDGRIMSINFKEGQDVKRGDVVAKIDPTTYQAQLDQAVAKKVLDEADLANTKRDLDRYLKLGANIVSQKSIDTQVAAVDKLTAQIKVDDAAIANAKAYLEYTNVLAPIDGRTGIRLLDEGNLVRGTDTTGQGIVVITELRPISVLFTLPQQQLAQVQKAQVNGVLAVEALDTDGKATLDRGTLQVVDNQVDPSTGTIKMKAEFPNKDLQLWPGQFVNVRVLTDTLNAVVVVPTPAVQRGPNGTFAYVLQQDDSVGVRPIAVAHQFETQAVITSGIAAGDRVVTTGFNRLKEGTLVSVAGSDEQPAEASASDAKAALRAKLHAACAADIERHCPDVERGGALRACLKATAAQLSEGCKAAIHGMAGAKRRKGAVHEAEGLAKG